MEILKYMQYEFLDHPAELRLKVFGKTKEELFKNAVLAMAEILGLDKNIKIEQCKTKGEVAEIKISSPDINALLIDFLSEILARSQINKKVYQVLKISLTVSPEKALLKSKILGCPIDRFSEDIKAVTYEDLAVKEKDEGWETFLVFDV